MSLVSQLNLAFTRIATEIKNRTTPSTGALSYFGTASADTAGGALSRLANLVTFQQYINLGSNGFANGNVIAALPSGFTPKTPVTRRCSIYAAGSGWSGMSGDVEITTDGKINLRWASTTVPASSILLLNFSFVGA